MVVKCSIFGCSNRKEREKDLHYYMLPAIISHQDEETKQLSSDRRREWLAKINQNFDNVNINNVRVCSQHFITGKKADLYDKNNPDWVPTVNIGSRRASPATPSPGPVSDGATPTLYRYNRMKERVQRKLDMNVLEDVDEVCGDKDSDQTDHDISTQTEIDSCYIQGMNEEIKALRAENEFLKATTVEHRFSEDSFKDDDVKVNNFTGISTFAALSVLFKYLLPYIPATDSLTKFQVLIMTLMRLRLNLSVMFLAHEFGISQSSVSRIFTGMIDVMFYRMKPFIHWPDRETLEKSMPMQFRKHFGRKCAVIIDCFEVFIERPSSVEARAETWSSYKHHNTVKFLIGITPQGSVSFISKAWGGRVSDKYITEHCGFLNKILPGDLVLADRGFDIKETIGSLAGQMKIPAFTKGRNQLSAADIEETRKLANVRIHVERVIGTVRQKYSILNGIIPIRFIMGKDENGYATIDKIGSVCCALINLNDSVVAFD